MNFGIELDIDDPGLDKITGQQRFVTLLRSVTTFVSSTASKFASATLPVAWLSFQPMANRNVLTWTDAANLYGTSAPPASGGVIAFQPRTRGLTPGCSSTLQNGQFGAAVAAPDPLAPFTYRAVNEQSDFFCFGLMGLALLNGVVHPHCPMNIQSTLLHDAVDFTLDPGAVTIALTNIGTDGTIIPVEAGGLSLTLNSASGIAKVGFDDSTNKFFVISE